MSIAVTLALLAASLVLAALCLWRGLSATKIGRVRMIPWTPLGFFFIVTAFMMAVHLANLAGFVTGRGR